ncbi:MAG: diacylglycerol kinase family protein [bacterium]|nr:diacylglycerol kinase family protein [bacterium]
MRIIESLKHALRGLKAVLKRERNARVHTVFAVLALLASWFFHISSTQLILVILAITLVFFAEIVNSAIEKTLDLISVENNQVVRIIKDICAAAVLVTAALAGVIAIIVFVPYIIRIFNK